MPSTTSNYKLPYPLSTDPANPPSDFKSLASTLDATITGFVSTSTQPTSAAPGQIWFNPTTGYIYYNTSNTGTPSWYNISNAVLTGTTTPSVSNPVLGQLYFNTSNGAFYAYNGTSWQTLFNFPATIGANGTVLTSNGSTPAWSSLPSATYNTPVAHAYCSQSSTIYLNNTMSTLGFDASNASDGGITITWSLTQNSGGSNFTALSSSNSVTGIKVATAGWYQITGTIGYQIPTGGSSAGLVGVSIATGTTSTSATGAAVRLYNGETVGGDVLSVQTSELLNLSSNTVVSLAGFAEQFYKILSGSSYLTLQLVSTTS